MDIDRDPDKGKKANISLCIICRRKNDEKLVEKPSSKKTLKSIKEWATCGEIMYIRNGDKLSFYSLKYLKEKSPSAQKLQHKCSALWYFKKSERALRKAFRSEIMR